MWFFLPQLTAIKLIIFVEIIHKFVKFIKYPNDNKLLPSKTNWRKHDTAIMQRFSFQTGNSWISQLKLTNNYIK